MIMLDSGLEMRQLFYGSKVTFLNPTLRNVEDHLMVVGTVN